MEDYQFNQVELKKLIDEASPRYEYLRKLNQSLSVGIGLLGIALSLGATISGILIKDDSRIAAIFGACAATTQAILFAYPTEKRSRAYRVLVARNENLRAELEVRQQTEAELQEVLEEFKSIRVQAALEEALANETDKTEAGVPDPSISLKNGNLTASKSTAMSPTPQTGRQASE